MRSFIRKIVYSSVGIIRSKQIQEALFEKFRMRCSRKDLCEMMRTRLGIVYKRVGVLTPQHNLHRNLLQRQYAAAKYIEILDAGKIIVNIDESVLR